MDTTADPDGALPDDRPGVLVLLATRDGARFLDEQLTSLLAQCDVEIEVLAGDDASTDDTVDRIRSAVSSDRLELVERGEPLGLPGSFLDLLTRAPADRAYYACCDQDDVWYPDKLTRAVQALRECDDRPALWACGYELVDSHGVRSGPAMPVGGYRPSFGNALVENLGPGCCMVWNRALQQQLSVPTADDTVMHDVWLYLSAAALGSVLWEPAVLVGYRQHDANAIGHGQSWRERVRQVREVRDGSLVSREAQAAAVLRHYGDRLAEDDRALAATVATGSRWARARSWSNGRLHRHRRGDNLLLLLRLLLLRHPAG